MKMAWFPHYCGGRILVGLYNDPGVVVTNKEQWRQEYKPRTHDEFLELIERKHREAGYPPGPGGTPLSNHIPFSQPANAGGVFDPWTACPKELETFKEVLRRMTQGHAIGIITAVTNAGQTDAASHLEACGFQVSANTNKYAVGTGCKHWHGDWHRVVSKAIQVTPLPA